MSKLGHSEVLEPVVSTMHPKQSSLKVIFFKKSGRCLFSILKHSRYTLPALVSGSVPICAHKWVCAPICKVGALGHSVHGCPVRGPHINQLPNHLISSKTRTRTKMFEEIFNNQGLNLITENILIKLDVKSLLGCRLVCKGLSQFIKSLEKSRKLKENDLKIIRRIRRKKFLIHPNWKAAFNLIHDEDNFYRRRGLIELLESYVNQDETQTFSLEFDQIMTDSYLNTSKFLIIKVG